MRGGIPNGDGTSDSFELFTDGDRRYRMTILTGSQAGFYLVWDGKSALVYDPQEEPKYQRIENPNKDEYSEPPNFYRPGTEQFKQLCPAAKRLGTNTLFGRTAVRYHCDKVQSDQMPEMDAREMALDEKTGLVLDYGSPQVEIITDVTFGPVITTDTFSTEAPPGASVGTPEDGSSPVPPGGDSGPNKIGSFRLNAVGGGFVDSKSYRGRPLVIVAGSADGIRTAIGRLLPMTRAGKPPVVGFLLVIQEDYKGTWDQQAASISKSVGKFAVPVGIDFKGAASYAFVGGDMMPPGPTQPTIALVASDGTFTHVTPAPEVTDSDLRDWIAALS